MRRFIIIGITLVSLALVATAQAGNGSVCKDASAQSGTGAAFASMRECQKASEVFSPALTIAPSHVGANEQFTLTATGFHANATTTVSFAITGSTPYGSYAPYYPTNADGSFSIPFVFAACRQIDTGGDVTVDLTLTFVDSFGVHASAEMTLC